MKLTLLTLALFVARGTGQPDPFDQYLSHIKSRRADSDWKQFLEGCPGVETESQPIRAVQTGSRWSTTSDIGKAFKQVESDFFDSAEIWGMAGKPRLVELWSLTMDVQSEIRSFVCLADDGHISRIRVTNWSFEIDGDKNAWRHELLEVFNGDGKILSKQSYFANASGERTNKPSAANGVKGFDSAPTQVRISRLLSELGQSAIHNQGAR